jgi:5'-3' exonuclease
VKGIGPKTAGALINHFKSLDNLFKQIDFMVATAEEGDDELLKPKKVPRVKKIPKAKAEGKVKGKEKGKGKGDIDGDIEMEMESEIETESESETDMQIEAGMELSADDRITLDSPSLPSSLSSSLQDSNREMKLLFLSELKASLSNVQASAGGTLKKLKTSSLSEVLLFKRLVTLRDDVHIEDLHGPLLSSSPSSSSVSVSASGVDGKGDVKDDIVINALKKKKAKKEKKIVTVESSETKEIGENPILENEQNSSESVILSPILFPEIINGRTQDLDSRLSKVDSSHFLYVGERDGAEQILSGMSSSFITPLSLLRLQYHKLERTLG